MKYRTTEKHPMCKAGIPVEFSNKVSVMEWLTVANRVIIPEKEKTSVINSGWVEPISEQPEVFYIGTKDGDPDTIQLEISGLPEGYLLPMIIETIEQALNPHEQKEGWTVDSMKTALTKGDWYSAEERIHINSFLAHLSTLQPGGNPEQSETEQPPIDALRYTWENMLNFGVHVGKHYHGADLAPDVNEGIRTMLFHWGGDIGKKPKGVFTVGDFYRFRDFAGINPAEFGVHFDNWRKSVNK